MTKKKELPKRTLFEIGDDILALEELLEELDGDVSDKEVENTITEWLQDNAQQLEQKLDGYAYLIKSFEGKAAIRKEEADRIKNLYKRDETNAKRLKERLKLFFQSKGIEGKIETKLHRIGLENNGGVAPLFISEVFAAHPENLPEEFQETIIVPNLEAIREYLESGNVLDWAEIRERGQHIRIR